MIKVYSFDVFDTSLVRRVASSSDVFGLVAKLIACRHGESPCEEWAQDFTAARIEAQERAVAAAGGRECTLEQIWANLHELLQYLPKSCGPESELAVERDLLRPNHWVASKIAGLRARGTRIVFTTDTYLPEDFVRNELIGHSLAKESDGFYVSSAIGVTKHTNGKLFDVLLKEENVAAREVHHLGDNMLVDVQIARRRGIKATWFTGSRLNSWESAILNRRTTARQQAATMVGAMRAARLSAPCPAEAGVHELVSTFLGPALTIWAAWVLGAAQRDKMSRLYFCSRDCYLLWRAARVLAPHFNDIDCRYLKISRRAVYVPSLIEINQAGMVWMRLPGERAPLRKLVQRAGLDWEEIADAFSTLAKPEGGDKILVTEDEWDAFWGILRSPPLRSLVERRVQARRALAVAYFTSQGLMDPGGIGIVDIGWSANILAAVHRILHGSVSEPSLHGYYLGLHLGRKFPSFPGQTKALFYEDAQSFRMTSSGSSLVRHRQFVLDEVLGLAPHGSVREYRMSGTQPEASCADVPAAHIALVEQIANAAEAFCADQAANAIDYSDDTIARTLLEPLIEVWCAAPDEGALSVVARSCKYARDRSNPLGERPADLIEPWRLLDSIKYLVPGRWHQRLRIRVRHGLWAEGSLLRSRRLPARLVRLRETTATALRRQ